MFGEDALGYGGGKLILPLLITSQDHAQETPAQGGDFYLTCKQLWHTAPSRGGTPLLPALRDADKTGETSPHQASLVQALAQVPTQNNHSLAVVAQKMTSAGAGRSWLELSVRTPVLLGDPQIIVAAEEALVGEAEQISVSENAQGETLLSFLVPLRTAPGLDARQLARAGLSLEPCRRTCPARHLCPTRVGNPPPLLPC